MLLLQQWNVRRLHSCFLSYLMNAPSCAFFVHRIIRRTPILRPMYVTDTFTYTLEGAHAWQIWTLQTQQDGKLVSPRQSSPSLSNVIPPSLSLSDHCAAGSIKSNKTVRDSLSSTLTVSQEPFKVSALNTLNLIILLLLAIPRETHCTSHSTETASFFKGGVTGNSLLFVPPDLIKGTKERQTTAEGLRGVFLNHLARPATPALV